MNRLHVSAVALMTTGVLYLPAIADDRMASDFLNVQTAETVSQGAMVIGLGLGGGGSDLKVFRTTLHGNYGLFSGTELRMAAGLYLSAPLPVSQSMASSEPPNFGLGVKHQLWQADMFALAVDVFLGGPSLDGVQVGLPFTARLADSSVTLQPRVVLPSALVMFLGTFAGHPALAQVTPALGLQLGGYWALSPQWGLMAEIMPLYQGSIGFACPVRAGTRIAPAPGWQIDVTGGYDPTTYGVAGWYPENLVPLSVIVRYRL